jgi:hypothetical protein
MTRNTRKYLVVILCLVLWSSCVNSFPDAGKFSINVNSSQGFNGIAKNLYNGTRIYIKVRCESSIGSGEQHVKIGWILRETQCWNEYAFLDTQFDVLPTYYNKPDLRLDLPGYNSTMTNYVRQPELQHQCDDTITLNKVETLKVRVFTSFYQFVLICTARPCAYYLLFDSKFS